MLVVDGGRSTPTEVHPQVAEGLDRWDRREGGLPDLEGVGVHKDSPWKTKKSPLLALNNKFSQMWRNEDAVAKYFENFLLDNMKICYFPLCWC